MFHSGGGGGMAAAAPHEPVEQRQRQKPEPKRVWLDAIMSKTRQTDTSPFASAGSTPSSASGTSYMGSAPRSSGAVQMGLARKGAAMSSPAASLPPTSAGGVPQHQQQQDRWDPPARVGHFSGGPVRSQAKQSDPPIHAGGVPAEYYQQQAAAPSQPTTATTSSDVYQEQLDLDDLILAETMSLAFKQMVGEQDCCFIAKGICHLCGTNERHLIPVVNFCPEFHVNHSLCREHLRSMHRVRMEDIFAGKNRPTVSKRSLKCSVCSRSCPCSTCQLEKQHEISKYKRWLAGEREYELDSEDRSMGSDHLRMRIPVNPTPLGKKPQRGSFGSNASGGSGGGYEYLPDAGRSIRELYGSQRRHVEDAQLLAFQASSAPPQMDLSQDDDPRLLPNLQAGAKPPSHSYRGTKRAAKDVVTSAHSTALDVAGSGPSAFGPRAMEQSPPPGRAHPGEPLESPSAAHVLNCAESEKSLVRLLTTLNQEVASTVPAFTDPKDPAGTLPPPPPNSAKLLAPAPLRTPSPAEDHLMPSRSPDARSSDVERGAPRASAYAGDAAAPGSLSRNPKRKRDANDSVHADSETSSETSASNSKTGPGRKLTTHKRGEVSNSVRGAVPDRETAPKPSPTVKTGAKGKQKDTRQRAAPKASPTTGRKRNGDPSSNAQQSDKKSPAPRKPATPAARGSTPRGGHKDGRGGGKNTPGKRQSVQEDDDDDDDSEIDTNLDYCEVCFAAGDLVCCDVCPRSFHLACLKMSESDLPEGDWQCAECRKPSFFVRYRATVDMKQSIYGKCVEAIRCLKSHPYSKQFLSPVTNIEHYRKIVKQPMDLSTIEGKLKSDKYTKPASGQQQGEKIIDIDAFANDVRLVWSNCKLFNDDGSGITRAADELAAGFEDIYQDLKHYLKTLSARNAAKAASKSSPSRAESSAPSQPSKPSALSSGSTASVPPEGKKIVGAAGSASKSATSPAPASSAKADEAKQPKIPASTSTSASASTSASSTESDTGRPAAAANRAPSSSVTEAKSTPTEKAAEAAPSASPSSTESESKALAESKSKSSDNSEESKGGKS